MDANVVAPPTGLARLWHRLALPIDPIPAADVLLGLRPANARQLLAVAVAASPEADALLEDVPHVVRSLAVSTTSVPERCDGDIRGPVMWSATMAARSASPGAGGVFVCALPIRSYDTAENQVLVAALLRIARAAKTLDEPVDGPNQPPAYDVRRAATNGERARDALEHKALQGVSRKPVRGRTVHKARSGTKAAVFRSAIDLLSRSWAEVGADDLADYVDEGTYREHVLAADVLDVLESRGQVTEPLRLMQGWAVSWPFAYAHAGRESADGRSGVHVDGRPITSLTEL